MKGGRFKQPQVEHFEQWKKWYRYPLFLLHTIIIYTTGKGGNSWSAGFVHGAQVADTYTHLLRINENSQLRINVKNLVILVLLSEFSA